MYTNLLTMYSNDKISGIWSHIFVYDFCYVIALFVKLILGFFQVQAMAELGFRVKNIENFKGKLKMLNVCIGVVNTSAFVLMWWLAIEFMFVIHRGN